MIANKVSAVCPNRGVDGEGRIVCKIITSGDNEVSPSLCHECPARQIGCDHLKFALQKIGSTPITVRYATGRIEVLNDNPPRIAFLRAACAERVAPVTSPRECQGCPLHSSRCCAPVAAKSAVRVAAGSSLPVSATRSTPVQPACSGKVIPFPGRVAAAG